VDSHVNLGGIDQPVIGQRKVTHDIRMKEGEVNVLGGLMQFQETKTKVGIPGVSSIPLLGKLFTSDSQQKDTSELCIALIPHIVRRPEITAENLRSIAVGNQTVVHLSYGPRAGREPEKTAEQTPAQTPQPAPTPAAVAVTPVAPAAVTPPVAAPSPAAPATQPVQPPPPPGTPPAPAAAPAAANPAEAPKAILNFTPAQVQAKEGGTVNVSLVLSNASDLASMPLTINFEPKVLQLADVIRGPVWMADNMPPAFTKNVQNESGTASISFARGFGMKGLNGNGVVLTLVFQAVARGASQVTVSQAAPRNAAGDLIPMKSDPPPQTVINVQ
jgi:general secretion pathway protein D